MTVDNRGKVTVSLLSLMKNLFESVEVVQDKVAQDWPVYLFLTYL